MAHGVPDWGVTNAPRNVYQVLDLGELAARLGSIDSFDRRGDVAFLDDFEDGLAHWQHGGIGTGHDERITRARSRSGAYAVKLIAASDGAKNSLITHTSPLAFWSPTGAEFSFNLADATLFVDLYLSIQSATILLAYGIRYSWASGRLYYLDFASNWIPFATGVPTLLSAETFQTMKLVANPETAKYVRLLVNSTTYDLSAYSPASGAPAGAPVVSLGVEIVGPGATHPYMLVDDAIITQNEPP
jgi:hypothetical protein